MSDIEVLEQSAQAKSEALLKANQKLEEEAAKKAEVKSAEALKRKTKLANEMLERYEKKKEVGSILIFLWMIFVVGSIPVFDYMLAFALEKQIKLIDKSEIFFDDWNIFFAVFGAWVFHLLLLLQITFNRR